MSGSLTRDAPEASGAASVTRKPSWRKYQEEIASFFRTLGMDAEVCANVEGARAVHEIDVLATFQSQGLRHSWAAECKRHKRPVTKADIETFKSIIADIGAHRGFVLSESGFQAGAIAAARKTNITLTNLAKLRENAEPDVLRSLLEALEQAALLLQERLMACWIDQRHPGPGTRITSSPRLGVDGKHLLPYGGAIGMLLTSIGHAKIGRFPVVVPTADLDGNFASSSEFVGEFGFG